MSTSNSFSFATTSTLCEQVDRYDPCNLIVYSLLTKSCNTSGTVPMPVYEDNPLRSSGSMKIHAIEAITRAMKIGKMLPVFLAVHTVWESIAISPLIHLTRFTRHG